MEVVPAIAVLTGCGYIYYIFSKKMKKLENQKKEEMLKKKMKDVGNMISIIPVYCYNINLIRLYSLG